MCITCAFTIIIIHLVWSSLRDHSTILYLNYTRGIGPRRRHLRRVYYIILYYTMRLRFDRILKTNTLGENVKYFEASFHGLIFFIVAVISFDILLLISFIIAVPNTKYILN